MNYAEYKAMTDATPIDQDLYRKVMKDAVSADSDRLSAILNAFISLNVPENYQGDVEEIRASGLMDIATGDFAKTMLDYAEMIWSMPPDLSDSIYNTLEQLDG